MALDCDWAIAFYLCVASLVLGRYKRDKHAYDSSPGLAFEGVWNTSETAIDDIVRLKHSKHLLLKAQFSIHLLGRTFFFLKLLSLRKSDAIIPSYFSRRL
ncbi:hypothetical protein CWE07_07805 [Aliidiomarina maris]|uniref:Uncharacterized protein n=1 Tax=Aliidiomarina maris TaxID=531312 RepID=A0ABY0BRQ3_9GAMM|nr:hypothetical protein CWE07_07805 [Aliidiomarina maris]